MMAALISIDVAKDELRIVTDDENADLQQKIEEASAFVVDYLKDRADVTWDQETVPKPIQAGILTILQMRYERDPTKAQDYMRLFEWQMYAYRDPSLA
jgi:hypothetical protein